MAGEELLATTSVELPEEDYEALSDPEVKALIVKECKRMVREAQRSSQAGDCSRRRCSAGASPGGAQASGWLWGCQGNPAASGP
jgi:hypothetical protein